MSGTPDRRLASVGLLVFAILFALGVQLARLQLVAPNVAPELSRDDLLRVIQSEPPRGLIYDRHGNQLVDNVAQYLVRLVPAELPEGDAARRRVLRTVERDTGTGLSRLEEMTSTGLATIDPLVPVPVYQVPSTLEAIRLRTVAAGLPGVEVVAVPGRVYRGGELFAHILGHVGAIDAIDVDRYRDAGYPLNAVVGRSGLESIYEEDLRGEAARRLVVAEPNGRELSELATVAAQPGADLLLSVDSGLQAALADALAEQIDVALSERSPDQGAAIREGGAVVINIKTGDVLAQVSLPSFDVNILVSGNPETVAALLGDPRRPLIDRTYMVAEAPGSIFKTLVAYAALEEGIATSDTLITSHGAIVIQDQFDPETTYIFRDWAAHGTLDLSGGLARSSNVYFYYLAGGYRRAGDGDFEGLGGERLAHYARLAGLGSSSGLDLPGEHSGLVPDDSWKQEVLGESWYIGDTYNLGIGQGYLSTSPMQMAVWAAAVANNGRILEPRLVTGVKRANDVYHREPVVLAELSNEHDSLAVVREGMRAAASDFGTARRGQPQGLTIGGKTGTAEFGPQLPDQTYESHGWYIGFAPFEAPEIAIAVYLGHGSGAFHAAPVARAAFEHYFADRWLP